MTKKKLLFVITKSAWGGAGRYVFDLATALKDEYHVAVALGGNGPLAVKLEAAGVRTISIPSLTRDIHTLTDTAAFFELRRIIAKEKPDIVHLNSSKAGGLGALAARFCGVQHIVFTAHGWAYNEPVSPLSKLFRWAASLATLILSHKVITVSHFDQLHAPLGLHTTIVHNGMTPPNFVDRATARRILAEKAPITDQTLVIGTITELTKNKGNDILVEAATLIKDAVVVVIGGGEDRTMLEQMITNYHLEGRVHLVGFVDNAATLLKGFDIFVLPSRKEGLPYAILEAGAAGLPVVSTYVGGIPEIIDDQLSGLLVPAYDAAALAEALNELQKSPNTRARYGEALKEKVLRLFGQRGMVKHTAVVYES